VTHPSAAENQNAGARNGSDGSDGSVGSERRGPSIPGYIRKQRYLGVDGGNVQIVIYLKSNHLVFAAGAGKAEKKSYENEGISQDVIENTHRIRKFWGYAKMFMKTSSLFSRTQDVDENTSSYA
jgi:hypothetical protein